MYRLTEAAVFCKTKERFGELSNMAAFPIIVNGHRIRTSEALYQACRFPDHPNIQKAIIDEKSPMAAKMRTKPDRDKTRADWNEVNVEIMDWAMRVKVAYHFIKLLKVLKETGDLPIVEKSHKDRFWGAVPEKGNLNVLNGTNVLGMLWDEIRKQMFSDDWEQMLVVAPPKIPNFKLFGEEIAVLDLSKKVDNLRGSVLQYK